MVSVHNYFTWAFLPNTNTMRMQRASDSDSSISNCGSATCNICADYRPSTITALPLPRPPPNLPPAPSPWIFPAPNYNNGPMNLSPRPRPPAPFRSIPFSPEQFQSYMQFPALPPVRPSAQYIRDLLTVPQGFPIPQIQFMDLPPPYFNATEESASVDMANEIPVVSIQSPPESRSHTPEPSSRKIQRKRKPKKVTLQEEELQRRILAQQEQEEEERWRYEQQEAEWRRHHIQQQQNWIKEQRERRKAHEKWMEEQRQLQQQQQQQQQQLILEGYAMITLDENGNPKAYCADCFKILADQATAAHTLIVAHPYSLKLLNELDQISARRAATTTTATATTSRFDPSIHDPNAASGYSQDYKMASTSTTTTATATTGRKQKFEYGTLKSPRMPDDIPQWISQLHSLFDWTSAMPRSAVQFLYWNGLVDADNVVRANSLAFILITNTAVADVFVTMTHSAEEVIKVPKEITILPCEEDWGQAEGLVTSTVSWSRVLSKGLAGSGIAKPSVPRLKQSTTYQAKVPTNGAVKCVKWDDASYQKSLATPAAAGAPDMTRQEYEMDVSGPADRRPEENKEVIPLHARARNPNTQMYTVRFSSANGAKQASVTIYYQYR